MAHQNLPDTPILVIVHYGSVSFRVPSILAAAWEHYRINLEHRVHLCFCLRCSWTKKSERKLKHITLIGYNYLLIPRQGRAIQCLQLYLQNSPNAPENTLNFEMATFSAENALELRSNLLAAAMQCSERCLYQSAKWYRLILIRWHRIVK